jgi:hypothetical protein
MLPLAMLVMLAMAVPTNIGGWGPREGAAAWLFGAAGLGADQGVTAATVYGVMVIAATLPGAAVLIAVSLRRGHRIRPPRLGEVRGHITSGTCGPALVVVPGQSRTAAGRRDGENSNTKDTSVART